MRKSVPLLGAFLLAGAAAALEVAEAAAARTRATPHPDVIDDLVAANRILSDQGVVDGFGHVSVRHETDPGRFCISARGARRFSRLRSSRSILLRSPS